MKKVQMIALSGLLAFMFTASVSAEMPQKCADLKQKMEECSSKKGVEKKKCRRQVRRANKDAMKECRSHMKKHKKHKRPKK